MTRIVQTGWDGIIARIVPSKMVDSQIDTANNET